MTVRIVDDRRGGTIPVRELRDGQLGEITEWGECPSSYCGRIVQGLGELGLVTLGRDKKITWGSPLTSDNFRVRILPNGTRLEVTDNE